MTDNKNRFPYEETTWASGSAENAKAWFEALERIGPANVRARLAQNDAGSRGAMSIGTVQTMTKGFAEEWLAWHDRQTAAREANFRGWQIFWTRWAAIAASVAALAAAVGWALTIYWRK
jgi:broad specificity phosphatase PhoE